MLHDSVVDRLDGFPDGREIDIVGHSNDRSPRRQATTTAPANFKPLVEHLIG